VSRIELDPSSNGSDVERHLGRRVVEALVPEP
jgi:hypothetical protein